MAGRFPFLDDDELARRMRGLASGGAAAAPGSRPPLSLRSAEVVLDSSIDPLDALRSAGTLEGRQIVARTDELTVVVDLCRDGDDFLLTGQLVDCAEGLEPVVVQVLDEGGVELAIVVVGTDGEFECASPIRPHELVVSCESGDVVIELLDAER